MARPVPSAQRALAFETDRRGRNDTELCRALTKVLDAFAAARDPEEAVRESFAHATAGLGADKSLVAVVRTEHPLDIAVLHSIGLTPENESELVGLRPSPDMSPMLVRRCTDEARVQLVENSQRDPSVAGPHEQPFSVVCAPVLDSLSGAIVAVLYFQNPVKYALTPEDADWVGAYAVALGQALTLQMSRQHRLQEPGAGRASADAPPLDIVGCSPATQQLGRTLKVLVASTRRPDPPPILVYGESGTGKEQVARYLHRHSERRERPFVPFNCASLRGDLAKTELFGHVKGSFTGAVADSPGLFRAANKGTLFLDEIGEMPLEGQALLLRVLETRMVQPVGDVKETPVDVQIVLATNRRLEDEVEAKRFREDLYYRVNALQVSLLPLRDPNRIQDIRPLGDFFLDKHERALKKKTLGLTNAAFRAFLRYGWPGNVRQLNNVIDSLVTYAEPGAPIDLADIERWRPELLNGPRNPHPEAILEDETSTHEEAMAAFQKKLILDRLDRCGGKAAVAAKSLDISGPTFYRYLTEAKKPG